MDLNDSIVSEFISVTQTDHNTAKFYLNSCNGDLKAALNQFFSASNNQPESVPVTNETAPNEFVPQNNTQQRSIFQSAQRSSNMRTLSDLNTEKEGDNPQQFFAGGEKSGMMVEGPPKDSESSDTRSLLDQILKKAKETAAAGNSQNAEEVETRELTLWSNGLSVEDEFYSYDTPQGKKYLEMIKKGVAPKELLKIKDGQQVEVRVLQKVSEEYKKPKVEQKPFTGAGHRLGNVVPQQTAPRKEQVENQKPPTNEIDPSKPVTSIQIRYSNGKRQVVKFNTNQTIRNLRLYIESYVNDDRQSVLSVYPNKKLDDDDATLEEANLLNCVIIHRFA